MGLWRSGLFDQIVGVDIKPEPEYPFDFIQADAITFDIDGVSPDFIWASPPCQRFTEAKNLVKSVNKLSEEDWEGKYPDLIHATRKRISPYKWTCIENVPYAPISPDIVLAGGNVGIPHLYRKRLFEVSWDTMFHDKPFTIGKTLLTLYGTGAPMKKEIRELRKSLKLPMTTTLEEMQTALQCEWVSNKKSICEGIPPKYATYVINDAVKYGFGGVS